MKMSKDDLIKKINDKVMDEDVKIELMESKKGYRKYDKCK